MTVVIYMYLCFFFNYFFSCTFSLLQVVILHHSWLFYIIFTVKFLYQITWWQKWY